MTPSEVSELEAQIAAARQAGDLSGAASRAVQGYGPEVLGLLVSLSGDEAVASDAFSELCEDLWRGLPGFAARSSFRTWMYTLARHALSRVRRGQGRGAQRGDSALAALPAQVRDSTLIYLRSQVKDGFARLRESLPQEDQALLILRVDRGLPWTDLARILCDDLDDEGLAREAARLRKRYQLLKDRLREAARDAGLLGALE